MTKFTSLLFSLFFIGLSSCGVEEDIQAAVEEKRKVGYDIGYQWAKEHAITDQDSCARFLNISGKSPELEGCIDFHREYLEKKRVLDESEQNFNVEGAPTAQVEENLNTDESCGELNEFCTN